METLRLDKDTAEKLEAIAAARGETPAQVVRGWVEKADEPARKAPLSAERRAELDRFLDETRREWTAANPDDTRDARRIVNDMYDAHGLAR